MGQVTGSFNARTVESAEVSLSLGPAADVSTLNVAGHYDEWERGEIVLSDGATELTLYNFDPVDWKKRSGPNGDYTEVHVRDRRWRWEKAGQITGEYNKPGADGAENQEQSVRALVALCLAALGEDDYVVDALPTDFYPYVRWEFAKPLEEAARLCEMCNCVIGFNADVNLQVYELGTGQAIPSGYKESNDLGVQTQYRPTAYIVRGAQAIIQRESPLVPVGLDVDKSIKPLADLSYKAAAEASSYGSLEAAARDYFADWAGGTASISGYSQEQIAEFYECASLSIWKWFRLPTSEQEYLPVLATICETEVQDGKTVWQKPYVRSPLTCAMNGQSQEVEMVRVTDNLSYDLDEKLGLVKFDQQVRDATGQAPNVPTIYMTWAHHSVSSTGALRVEDFYCYVEGDAAITCDDTVQTIEADWLQLRGTAEGEVITWINETELDAIAAKIISYIDPGDAEVESAEILYSGIKDLWIDGRVRNITWHVGTDGASTRIIYNTERPPIGGARIERQISNLKRRYEARLGAATGDRLRLAGAALPDIAAAQKRDRRNAYALSLPGAVPVLNDSDEDCPQGGCLWTGGGRSESREILVGRKPEYPGVTEFHVAATPIPAKSIGLAYPEGNRKVLLAAAEWAAAAVRMRFDLTAGKWTAQRFGHGPLIVTEMLNSPYVRARVTRERGSSLFLSDEDNDVEGSGKTLRLGDGLCGTMEQPGVMRIDKEDSLES